MMRWAVLAALVPVAAYAGLVALFWRDGRPGSDVGPVPVEPEWVKHDGSEPKQAAITAHVAPAGRELGIAPPPAADVWRFYEVPDVEMQPALSRVRGGLFSKGGTNLPPSVNRPLAPKAEGRKTHGSL